MKKTLKLSGAALALALISATPAFAKDHGHQHASHQYGRDDQRNHDGRYNDARNRDTRYDDGRRYHVDGRGRGHWDNGRRGAPAWARGKNYRSYGYNNVVVVQPRYYRQYQLPAPQPGYQWMRDNAGHAILVSIASGVISNVLARHGL